MDEDEAAARISDDSLHQKKKGVCASDLGPACKWIIERAWHHFCFGVATFPYPDSEDQINKWARESWYAGLGELIEGMGYIGSSDPTEYEMALVSCQNFPSLLLLSSNVSVASAACLAALWSN